MQIGSLTSPVVDVVAAGFPVVTVGDPLAHLTHEIFSSQKQPINLKFYAMID